MGRIFLSKIMMEGNLCQEGIATIILKCDENMGKIYVEWIKPA